MCHPFLACRKWLAPPLPSQHHTITLLLPPRPISPLCSASHHPAPPLPLSTPPQVWGYFSVKGGGAIHEYSDSQFGHLFAKGETREAAIRAMVVALKEIKIRWVAGGGGRSIGCGDSRYIAPPTNLLASASLRAPLACLLLSPSDFLAAVPLARPVTSPIPPHPAPPLPLLLPYPQGRDPHHCGLCGGAGAEPRLCGQHAPHGLAGRTHLGAGAVLAWAGGRRHLLCWGFLLVPAAALLVTSNHPASSHVSHSAGAQRAAPLAPVCHLRYRAARAGPRVVPLSRVPQLPGEGAAAACTHLPHHPARGVCGGR